MAEYRRSAHAVFDLKYHAVWITKNRYKILRGRVAERARDLIRQSCEAREVVIMRGAVSPDHIHMLLSAPAAGGVPGVAKAVLGAAPVGSRVLLRDGGRGNDQGIYREPKVGRRRSGLQDYSADRALSRPSAGVGFKVASAATRFSVNRGFYRLSAGSKSRLLGGPGARK